ncbi:MAG: hypothetical protein FJY20_06805 [Bacteroidetes bacterium]|nr:hypothetical protein [Bacteroidota bacterium]
MNKKLSIRQRLVICSVFLYAIACAYPIFREDDYTGITALLRGWIGVVGGVSPVFLSWLANIAYFIALLVPARSRTIKIGCSIASLLLGLSFLAVKEIPFDEGGSNLDVSPGIAFYFWMAGFSMLYCSHFFIKENTGGKAGG